MTKETLTLNLATALETFAASYGLGHKRLAEEKRRKAEEAERLAEAEAERLYKEALAVVDQAEVSLHDIWPNAASEAQMWVSWLTKPDFQPLLETVKSLKGFDVYVSAYVNNTDFWGVASTNSWNVGRCPVHLYLIDRETGEVFSKKTTNGKLKGAAADLSNELWQSHADNDSPTRQLRVAVLPFAVVGVGMNGGMDLYLEDYLVPVLELIQEDDRFKLAYVYEEEVGEKFRVAIEQENAGE